MVGSLGDKIFGSILRQEGYNPYNTAFYAFIVVLIVELYWRFFVKSRDVNEFRSAALPYAVAGGFFRFLNNRLFHQNFFTVTPGIFIVFFTVFTFLVLVLGEKKTRLMGWVLAGLFFIPSLFYLKFSKILYAFLSLLTTGVIVFFLKKISFMDDGFAWIPHIFESWVTSFGVIAGLIEEHVLAGAIMRISPLLFGVVKTLVLVLIMYLIKDVEKEEKHFVGTVIGVFGLAPGIRDFLELLSL